MKLLRRLVIGIPSVMMLLLILAYPVMAYLYWSPFTIVESGGTAYTMLGVQVAHDNQWLADNGFMQADALDTRIITTAGAEKPHMVADDRTLAAIPVPASSNTNLRFTTGNTDLSSMPIITGYGGYNTIADHANLEPADNFAFRWRDVYLNTAAGASKNLLNKTSAVTVDTGTTRTGYVTAAMRGVTLATETLYPDSAGLSAGIASENPPASAHWDVTSDANDGTYVYSSLPGMGGPITEIDYYNLDASALPAYSVINTVDVYFRSYYTEAGASGGNKYVYPGLRLGGTDSFGTAESPGLVVAEYHQSISRPGGGTWTVADFAAMQVVIKHYMTSTAAFASTLNTTECWVVVNCCPMVSRPAATGVHDVDVQADGTCFEIDIDNPTLALNGDMETADPPADWVAENGATLSRQVVAGSVNNYCMQVVSPAAWGDARQELIIEGDLSGQTITAGVYGKTTDAGVQIALWNGTTSAQTTVVANNAWNWTTVTWTVPALSPYVRVLLQCSNAGTSAYFDGASCVLGSTITQTTAASSECVAIGTASIPGNVNDWIIGNNETAIYYGSYEHTTAGVIRLLYEPTSMIISAGATATLPNELNPGTYDGTITWGANPAGVAVTLGSFEPGSTPIVYSYDSGGYRDVLPGVGASDWFTDPAVGGALLTNPLRPFITIMSDTTSMTELQAWRYFGLIFVLAVTATAAVAVHGHLLITGAACGMAIGLLVVMTVWPLWTLVFTIIAIVAGMVSERSPSV